MLYGLSGSASSEFNVSATDDGVVSEAEGSTTPLSFMSTGVWSSMMSTVKKLPFIHRNMEQNDFSISLVFAKNDHDHFQKFFLPLMKPFSGSCSALSAPFRGTSYLPRFFLQKAPFLPVTE